jgi:hypothetical protein
MRSGSKKLQVFVSSTYKDLRDERQTAVGAILRAGHIPAGMELFAAGDKSQWEVIKEWIDESDVLMLLLGGRYGTIEEESGKSYTQLEYEYALEVEKPVFAVVITDKALHEKVQKEGLDVMERENEPALRDFKELVLNKMAVFWTDDKDIKLGVMESLMELSRRDELIGWIRADQFASAPAVAEELARLSARNADLERRISSLSGVSGSDGTVQDVVTILREKKLEKEYHSLVSGLAEAMERLEADEALLVHAFWAMRKSLDGGRHPSKLMNLMREFAYYGLVTFDTVSTRQRVGDSKYRHVTNLASSLTDMGRRVAIHLEAFAPAEYFSVDVV